MTSKRKHEDSHTPLKASLDGTIVDGAVLYTHSNVLIYMNEITIDDGTPIPIPCTGPLLKLAVSYCEKFPTPVQFHRDTPLDDARASFNVNLDGPTLLKLGELAQFLEIDHLASYAAKAVAVRLTGKLPAEMREILNLPDDIK